MYVDFILRLKFSNLIRRVTLITLASEVNNLLTNCRAKFCHLAMLNVIVSEIYFKYTKLKINASALV